MTFALQLVLLVGLDYGYQSCTSGPTKYQRARLVVCRLLEDNRQMWLAIRTHLIFTIVSMGSYIEWVQVVLRVTIISLGDYILWYVWVGTKGKKSWHGLFTWHNLARNFARYKQIKLHMTHLYIYRYLINYLVVIYLWSIYNLINKLWIYNIITYML